MITGVSGWSRRIPSSLIRIGFVVLGLGTVEYGIGRVRAGVEGPKEELGGCALTGLLASLWLTSIASSSGITSIGSCPSTCSDSALARLLGCSDPAAVAEFEPSSVLPRPKLADSVVFEVWPVVLPVLEVELDSRG